MSESLNIEENSLIAGCLKQDRQSQRLLYEKYKRYLYTTAFRIVNDREYANDALQDGFIEIFRDIQNFRQQSSLGTWMRTIVVRKALTYCKLDNKTEEYNPVIHDEAITWPDGLTGDYLDKAIHELPDGYRSVFLLIEVEDYSHKEVAVMLGIKEGTSKSQLYHAKQILKVKLKELYER